ncbi:MAG TPA: protein phosphatase 2C domain-containing protein [Rhizomicrobium sp.]|jgi:serine/threonine protein phosphatase PrpC
MRFEQAARSHVGCRRKNNEDALICRPEIGLWAVADGMGGHAAGDVASALVVESLGDVAARAGIAALQKAAEEALGRANHEIYRLSVEKGRTMGSTVVTLLVEADGFACLWAGDSRAYLLRERVLRALTRDHSLVQQLVNSGDLTPEAALNHPNSNIITRAVGNLPALEIEHGAAEPIQAGDIFLLASDGLTRLLSEAEMAEADTAPDLDRLADRWVDMALERGAPDNLSFILLRVSGV